MINREMLDKAAKDKYWRRRPCTNHSGVKAALALIGGIAAVMGIFGAGVLLGVVLCS